MKVEIDMKEINLKEDKKETKKTSKNIFDIIEENESLEKEDKKSKKRKKELIPDNFTVGNIDNSTKEEIEEKNSSMFLKPLNWLYIGIRFECFIIYSIFKYALIGLLSPFIYIHVKVKENSLNSELKRQEREKRIIKEIEEKMKKKKTGNENTLEEKIDTKQEKIAKPSIIVSDTKEDNSFKTKIKKWFYNLPVIRNFDLQRLANEEKTINLTNADSTIVINAHGINICQNV